MKTNEKANEKVSEKMNEKANEKANEKMNEKVNEKLVVRPATRDDVEIVAETLYRAIWNGEPRESEVWPQMVDAVSREDTLFSWKNALVADCEGDSVGAIISYDGAKYVAARSFSFGLIGCDMSHEAMETGEGEYYLDSLAVSPEWRGKGIGTALMEAAIKKAHDAGFQRITLIVDIKKPKARAMYERLGFKPLYTLEFLGETYTKMYI